MPIHQITWLSRSDPQRTDDDPRPRRYRESRPCRTAAGPDRNQPLSAVAPHSRAAVNTRQAGPAAPTAAALPGAQTSRRAEHGSSEEETAAALAEIGTTETRPMSDPHIEPTDELASLI